MRRITSKPRKSITPIRAKTARLCMMAASFEAADQLKAFPEALKRAAGISAKVYNEQNGDYWLKYYQGTREQDKTGNMVELGGSAVNNLNDNLLLFGLQPGANNNFPA